MRFASQQTTGSQQFSMHYPLNGPSASSFTQDSIDTQGFSMITQSQTGSVHHGAGVGFSQLAGASQDTFVTDDFHSQSAGISQAGGDLLFSSQDPAFHSQGFTEY